MLSGIEVFDFKKETLLVFVNSGLAVNFYEHPAICL